MISNYETFKLLYPNFMKYLKETTGFEYSESSVGLYSVLMGAFFKWTDANDIRMLDVIREHVIEYRRSTGRTIVSHSEVRRIKMLKEFYSWLQGNGLIKSNPLDGIHLKAAEPGNKYVMNAVEIRIYRSLRSDIRVTAAFEIFISSGIRLSDLCNIRCCDVHVGKKPFDKIENCPSQYVGAAILIDPRSVRTKTRKRRLTYISVYALKMLKIYMDVMGLNFKMEAPLFPWSPKTLKLYFTEMGKMFREARDKYYSGQDTEDPRPLKINTDLITGDKFTGDGMNKRLAKRIKTRIRNINKSNKREHVLVDDVSDKRNLHVHCFRHTLAALMYHRDWTGGRKDVTYISHLLGHKQESQSFDYLTTVDILSSDSEWKTIWLGMPSDWRNTVIKQTDRGGWGVFGIGKYAEYGEKSLTYKERERLAKRREKKLAKAEGINKVIGNE